MSGPSQHGHHILQLHKSKLRPETCHAIEFSPLHLRYPVLPYAKRLQLFKSIAATLYRRRIGIPNALSGFGPQRRRADILPGLRSGAQLNRTSGCPRATADQTVVNIRERVGRRKQKSIGVGALCPFVCPMGPSLCLLNDGRFRHPLKASTADRAPYQGFIRFLADIRLLQRANGVHLLVLQWVPWRASHRAVPLLGPFGPPFRQCEECGSRSEAIGASGERRRPRNALPTPARRTFPRPHSLC